MPSALDLIGNNQVLQEHWVRRFVAAIIDAILLSIAVALISIFFFVGLSLRLYNPFFGGIGNLLWAGSTILYFTLFEGLSGHTPGKAILGLKVTAHLESMGLAKGFLRNLSKLYLLLLLIDFIVGFVMEGDPRQRFLDRVAGTTVVRTGAAALEEQQFHRPQYPGAPPQGVSAAPDAPPESPTWPSHELDPQGNPVKEKSFCSACGGRLVLRGDGRKTCTRCGAVY